METRSPSQIAQEYESIKSQFAGYSAESDAGKKIKAVSDSIKVPRHPVQPYPIMNELKCLLIAFFSRKTEKLFNFLSFSLELDGIKFIDISFFHVYLPRSVKNKKNVKTKKKTKT